MGKEDKMDGKSENLTMKGVWKSAIIKAAKIIALVFSVVCLAFAMLVYALPSTGAQLTSKLGMTNAERYCYNRIYERSGKATDLYNLVLFEENVGNVGNEFGFINRLTARTDYGEFCEKLDSASLSACKDKNMIAYVLSVNMFLTNQKIKCMYLLEIDTVLSEIRQNLKSENLLDNSVATYVSLVVEENLSTSQKVAKLSMIANNLELLGLIEQRISNLETKYGEYKAVSASGNGITQQFAEKVVYKYLLMNYYKACYSINVIAEFEGKNPEQAQNYKTLWQNAAAEYDALVK